MISAGKGNKKKSHIKSQKSRTCGVAESAAVFSAEHSESTDSSSISCDSL